MYNQSMSDYLPLLTITEVAERLRVHYLTVYRMVRDGRISAIQVGRNWRIPEAEVMRLLKPAPREA